MATTDIVAGSINLNRFLPENDARAKAIAEEIDTMNLDLFGCQETEEWIEDKLPGLLKDPWLVVSDHVNCPLFVRSDRYHRVPWNGEQYLTLDMPGSVRKRYGSAAMLKRLSDGLIFVAVTIHPSNSGESPNSATDRIRQAEYVWDRLVKWNVTQYPIMLLGDMNDRSWAPDGLPGVFVKHGFVDVLKALNESATIDRAFVAGFTPVSASFNKVDNTLSDHDFRIFVLRPESLGPGGETKPETRLERMNRIHGPVTKFKITSFENARKSKTPSRYSAIMQDWLDREVTTVWSSSDQKTFDEWRHSTFPKWFPFEYKGPAGITSVTKLAQVAKSKGKKVYPVVE